METHVLLPPELVLSLRPKSEDCTSPVVARFLEQSVTVTTRSRLEKGFQIHPAPINSTVRSGKLDIYSTLPANDVSTFHKVIFILQYGCKTITGDQIRNFVFSFQSFSKNQFKCLVVSMFNGDDS